MRLSSRIGYSYRCWVSAASSSSFYWFQPSSTQGSTSVHKWCLGVWDQMMKNSQSSQQMPKFTLGRVLTWSLPHVLTTLKITMWNVAFVSIELPIANYILVDTVSFVFDAYRTLKKEATTVQSVGLKLLRWLVFHNDFNKMIRFSKLILLSVIIQLAFCTYNKPHSPLMDQTMHFFKKLTYKMDVNPMFNRAAN